MHRSTEHSGWRRKKAPPRRLPDTFRTFNIELPLRNKMLERMHSDHTTKKQQQHYILESRNNPQPHYAKCITTNARFYNEPIIYMVTEDTKSKQDQWWPTLEPEREHPPKPPYDMKSTQRSDFQRPTCGYSRPVKHPSTLLPCRGIVPLVCPRTPASLPRIFQEQISFKNHYNSRATPCIPYQGKKFGAFVWSEITPKGETVPGGTKTLPYAEGSGSLEQPKTEKGHSVESCMTSPCLALPDSQETPDSGTHLSKTDISEGAKTEPRAAEKGEESVGNSQTSAVKVSPLSGEAPSKPPRKASLDKLQQPLPPVPTAEQTCEKIQAALEELSK